MNCVPRNPARIRRHRACPTPHVFACIFVGGFRRASRRLDSIRCVDTSHRVLPRTAAAQCRAPTLSSSVLAGRFLPASAIGCALQGAFTKAPHSKCNERNFSFLSFFAAGYFFLAVPGIFPRTFWLDFSDVERLTASDSTRGFRIFTFSGSFCSTCHQQRTGKQSDLDFCWTPALFLEVKTPTRRDMFFFVFREKKNARRADDTTYDYDNPSNRMGNKTTKYFVQCTSPFFSIR